MRNRLGLVLFGAEFDGFAVVLDICLELGRCAVFEELCVVVGEICLGLCRKNSVSKRKKVCDFFFNF